jgi:hypothetical protein
MQDMRFTLYWKSSTVVFSVAIICSLVTKRYIWFLALDPKIITATYFPQNLTLYKLYMDLQSTPLTRDNTPLEITVSFWLVCSICTMSLANHLVAAVHFWHTRWQFIMDLWCWQCMTLKTKHAHKGLNLLSMIVIKKTYTDSVKAFFTLKTTYGSMVPVHSKSAVFCAPIITCVQKCMHRCTHMHDHTHILYPVSSWYVEHSKNQLLSRRKKFNFWYPCFCSCLISRHTWQHFLGWCLVTDVT